MAHQKSFKLWLLVVLGCFAGGLAALRVNQWLDSRRNEQVASTLGTEGALEAVGYQTNRNSALGVGAPVDFRTAAKHVTPSVVSVDRLQAIQRFWGGDAEIAPTATGSGVVFSKDGYIVTNAHVVEGADEVKVRLTDGRSLNAKIIGSDSLSDLAVLKVDGVTLPPAELGDSAKLEVGEWVLAVGNPLGYQNTVSAGVVSSLGRVLTGDGKSLLVDAIQTDAAINQGNSGGALTNAAGQVVGINSAIASIGGGSIGIGFAIPINRVKGIVEELLKYQRVRYGRVGLNVYQFAGLLQDSRARAELTDRVGAEPPKEGLVVRSLYRSSAAYDAGIRPLDVILEANGKPLNDPIDLNLILMSKRAGDKLSLKIWSHGTTRDMTLTLRDQ